MRKTIGALLILAAAALTYLFATRGTLPGTLSPWGPFEGLGRQYPMDAALLIGAVWCLGLGLYFAIRVPVTAVGSFAPDGRFIPPPRSGMPVAYVFLINALLLATSLFAAVVGTGAGYAARSVPILAAVGGLQVAGGLILLILSLFERPKSPPSLILGSAVYLVAATVAVMAFVSGIPE